MVRSCIIAVHFKQSGRVRLLRCDLLRCERVLVMAGDHTDVFGIYRSDVQAGLAVVRLVDISIRRRRHFCFTTGQPKRSASPTKRMPRLRRVPGQGTAAACLAFQRGISALTIPGVGPFIAVGPIMAALARVGAGGAVVGLINALAGMGVPEFEATRYEGRIKEGAVLLSVRCDSPVSVTRAKNLLKQMGGQDIASSGETSAAHGAGTGDGPAARV